MILDLRWLSGMSADRGVLRGNDHLVVVAYVDALKTKEYKAVHKGLGFQITERDGFLPKFETSRQKRQILDKNLEIFEIYMRSQSLVTGGCARSFSTVFLK